MYKEINKKFQTLCQTGKLFRVSIKGSALWDIYLGAFDPEERFRDPDSSEHNCNTCKSFIRSYGNIVSIDSDNNITTMFDIELDTDSEYFNSVKAVKQAVLASSISEMFIESYNNLTTLKYGKSQKTDATFRLGVENNYKLYTKEEAEKFGVVTENQTISFPHFYLDLPRQFVDFSQHSVESIMAGYRSSKEVFKRAMDEISLDTLELVRDLIHQGSLLDGTTHLYKVEEFIVLKKEYDNLLQNKDNWAWNRSYQLPIAKFKNELIGVLCTELAEGKELNQACQAWNKRVDPVNYMKTSSPITARQIEEAKKFVEDNGYVESFNRRIANIDDIKVSEILHSNIGDGGIKDISIFDNVKATSTRHKRSEFDGVEEVSIDKFMKDILPTCTSLELYLQNNQSGNLVALTTAIDPSSEPIFKWSNNYSWTFNGNLAGKSQIKDNVKTAGGSVDGILRCSLQWNDEDTLGNVDLDLHCREPRGSEIYYGCKKSSNTGGWLDVDMIRPTKVGIENISWQNTIPDGVYRFSVKNYDGGNNNGFKIEIEFDGQIFNYIYNNSLSRNQVVEIAVVTVKNGAISIKHLLPETNSNRVMWGLETNNFHKVSLVCLSPNHWGENNVGNKHYLFMLDKCEIPSAIRSFHNENLIAELAEHRKVLEVLGTQAMIKPEGKQLSGLGFNSTVSDVLILKLKGTHQRVIKLKI